MSCCAPKRNGAVATTVARAPAGGAPTWSFAMGDHFDEGEPADGETPVHEVRLSPFALEATVVTNDAFAAFVLETGYVTDAERFGSSAVFHGCAAPDADVAGHVPETPWWLNVRGATWRAPGGGSSCARRGHPVVHVSWNDAAAYAEFAGKRLPTEAEWEYAARGGVEGRRFPWGDELRDDLNIFRGEFPARPERPVGTVRADSGAPNGFGLFNVVGNVWEWCADWFSPSSYAESEREDPRGPHAGTERVLRGGSYLCHDSYCRRYRVAARTANTPESSAANIGFRCAIDCTADGTAAPLTS